MSYKITIPTELSEIKLKDLLTFSALDQSNERQIMYKAFDLFMGIDKHDVNLIPLDVADKAIRKLTDTLNSKPEERLIIELNGVRYGRIPNLENISFGEYIDLDTFVTPMFTGEVNHENAFQFLSVLYRPIIDEVKGIYRIEDFDDNYLDSEHWRIFQEHCPADIYATSIGFFLNLRIELLKAMQDYFKEVGETQHKVNLHKIGDGMEVLKRMQQANLSHLTKPVNTLLNLPSIHLPTMQKQGS